MKRLFRSMMIAAIVAVSFISCQKAPVAQTENTITMRLHASSSTVDTRTYVSENQNGGYDINWSAGDKVQVIEFVDNEFSQNKASNELESVAQISTFEVALEEKTGTSFLYETVYPAAAYSMTTSGNGETFYRLNISDNQTYSESSFDGAADVLISRPVHESEQPEELGLEYKRIGSAARMVLKGITANETITKITFSTDEGYIAGYSRFDPTTAEFNGTYAGGSKKSIELTPASATVATGADVVWFRLYAITLTEGFKVVVTTDAATYTKNVDLKTANRQIAFNDGGLTKFNVAFAAENREVNSTAQYVLVTDASSLSAGDIIRIGCVEEGKAAGPMGTEKYFTSVDAQINNGVLNSNEAIDITLGGTFDAWTLTTYEGQITANVAGALILNTGNAKTWKISIDNNVAKITDNTTDEGYFQYNSSSPRFLNYKATSRQKPIEIYKLSDGKSSQSISFGETTEFFITMGDEFVAPQLSGNMTDVTYSSSNSNVATVNETSGSVSIVGVGSATITANAVENSDYRAATASYTIIVNPQSGDDDDDDNGKYVKVTSTTDLVDGKYLIVYETGSVALNGALTADAAENTVNVTISNGEIASTSVINAAAVTYNAAYGSFLGGGGKYIGHTGTSNTLNYSDDALANVVTFDSGNVVITAGDYVMRYNATSGQDRFRYYKSGQQAIQLYKYEASTTPDVTLTSICIKTVPTKLTYTAGEQFDPTGLIITKTMSNANTEDVYYAGHESEFSFDPSLTTALTTADADVTISYGGKAVRQAITVNAGGGQSGETITLFTEGFGDNTGSARNWNDSYKEQGGISTVYSNAAYTMTNLKQGKNTTGSTLSGINQSATATDAVFEFGPLNVSGYTDLQLSYKWKAASIKGTYFTKVYYKTSQGGSYTEVATTGTGATTFVDVTASLPAAANGSSTLYLKIVFNTSNTQAIIDEVILTGKN